MSGVVAPAQGSKFATDPIDGTHFPISKLAFGNEGTATPVSPATGLPVALSTADAAAQGPRDEAAPETDTAPAGLNGRLQRIAQRLSTLLTRLPASLGQKTKDNSLPVAIASDQTLTVVDPGMGYEYVAAGQADQKLGAAGALGDYLSHIVIQPAVAAAGSITIKDGVDTVFAFTGGAALGDLAPRTVAFGARAKNAGGWSVTTGANIAVTAFGDFT